MPRPAFEMATHLSSRRGSFLRRRKETRQPGGYASMCPVDLPLGLAQAWVRCVLLAFLATEGEGVGRRPPFWFDSRPTLLTTVIGTKGSHLIEPLPKLC